MKVKILILLFAIAIAGCSTSREGCAGAKFQGTRYKSYKFSW
jgi:hypothetical protein